MEGLLPALLPRRASVLQRPTTTTATTTTATTTQHKSTTDDRGKERFKVCDGRGLVLPSICLSFIFFIALSLPPSLCLSKFSPFLYLSASLFVCLYPSLSLFSFLPIMSVYLCLSNLLFLPLSLVFLIFFLFLRFCFLIFIAIFSMLSL